MIEAMNFRWVDDISIGCEHGEFDLHNQFDFISFDYSIAEKTIRLSWAANEYCHMNFERISILIEEVHHLNFKPRDPELPFSEDRCLEMFGHDDGTLAEDKMYTLEKETDDAWYWAFQFHSGARIIVGAKTARLYLAPLPVHSITSS